MTSDNTQIHVAATEIHVHVVLLQFIHPTGKYGNKLVLAKNLIFYKEKSFEGFLVVLVVNNEMGENF